MAAPLAGVQAGCTHEIGLRDAGHEGIEGYFNVQGTKFLTKMCQFRTSPQVDGGVQSKLEEIIQYKNDIIAELHGELQRTKDAHVSMARAYESKLGVGCQIEYFCRAVVLLLRGLAMVRRF